MHHDYEESSVYIKGNLWKVAVGVGYKSYVIPLAAKLNAVAITKISRHTHT